MVIVRLGSPGINQVNARGELPLSVACINNKPDNVEVLLRFGANPICAGVSIHPIHHALKHNSVRLLH